MEQHSSANSMEPDPTFFHSFGRDLGPNCLQRLPDDECRH